MSTDNPYSSPTTSAAPQVPAPNRDLGWLLFSFTGRIPRRAFWGVRLALTVVNIVMRAMVPSVRDNVAVVFVLAVYLPVFWISFAVGIKRWHDRDKSGWWTLIYLLPIVGWIWAFVELACLRGTVGPNQYGQDPT